MKTAVRFSAKRERGIAFALSAWNAPYENREAIFALAAPYNCMTTPGSLWMASRRGVSDWSSGRVTQKV